MATQQMKCLAAVALLLAVSSRWMGPDASAAQPESAEPIYILMCAKKMVNFNHRMAHLARMFDSILKTARRRPLNWILPTLPADVPVIHKLLERIKLSRAQVSVQVDYIDLDVIKRQYAGYINVSRQFFLNTKPLESSVYWDEVFHISMVYHLMFPFRQMIALDMDTKFVVDIAELADLFDQMSPDSVVTVGHDLTPHYWYDFRRYRDKNPGTRVGQVRPGLQGFNTGVMLMDLERMRRNRLYNSLLNPMKIGELVEKYEFDGTLAHQDWFTLIGMEEPQLFNILDCTWNRQLDATGIIDEKFTGIFNEFHECNGTVKVYHANGGSLMPENDLQFAPSVFEVGNSI